VADVVDFFVTHSEAQLAEATWVAECLRRAGFTVETHSLEDVVELILNWPRVGTILLLTSRTTMPGWLSSQLRREQTLVVGVGPAEGPPLSSPWKTQIRLVTLDHKRAAELLAALEGKFARALSPGERSALKYAITSSREASRIQKRVFLSYRREDRDSFHVCDRIAERLGDDRVFTDSRSLPPGAEWAKTMERELESCSLLLALIGPNWIETRDEQGHRKLDREDDWVRGEIRSALKRKAVNVVPVLLAGARMPTADQLPQDLSALPGRQFRRLNDESWRHDFNELIEFVAKAVE